MVQVTRTADARWFVESGAATYAAIVEHVPRDNLSSVLDFGCGCGRVLRHWNDFNGELCGSDVNSDAVHWCRANLPHVARVEVNGGAPPLVFDDSSFDLVYAVSVFTHLTEPLQLAWRDELRRVLRPGGYLIVTTQGRAYRPRLLSEERDRFDRGELVVRRPQVAGTNLCSSYHPAPYLRGPFAERFEFLRFTEEIGGGSLRQDLSLLRKAP
jgi:SAM-dependent methyltransferase